MNSISDVGKEIIFLSLRFEQIEAEFFVFALAGLFVVIVGVFLKIYFQKGSKSQNDMDTNSINTEQVYAFIDTAELPDEEILLYEKWEFCVEQDITYVHTQYQLPDYGEKGRSVR